MILAAVLSAVTLATLAPVAGATNIGYEGCTPGYWKNHPENWEESTPDDLLSQLGIPTKPGWLFHASIAGYGDWTLMEALNAQGGTDLNGAAEILIRAGAAAWLNAAHEGLGYPYRRFSKGLDGRPSLIYLMNSSLLSGSRWKMLNTAAKLDAANNLGCPLPIREGVVITEL
jgi:hypothetical protein